MLTGFLLFAAVLFLPQILNDSDTLWQIRTGEWILDHRAIPATDPFSFSAGARHWFAHEWLAETLMALAFRAGGMPGVMALTAGATAVTAALLVHHLKRFLPGAYVAVALVFALANAAPSLLARPHLLAWPFLVLWCGGLVAARANRTAPPLPLLLIMLLWVNLHGSFLFGLLLPGAFLIEVVLDRGATDRRVLAGWVGFFLAGWAVALLNPDFLAGVLFPFQVIGMQSKAAITEWRPADFGAIHSLEITILAGLALGFTGKVRLPPVRLLMLLALVHSALAYGRNGPLLGIVGALIVAEPIGASLCPEARPGCGGTRAANAVQLWMASGAGMLALAALALRLTVPVSPDLTGASFAATLNRVPEWLRARPVLNGYGLGGKLIFYGVRPFIDGRADLYGDVFVSRYERMIAPNPSEIEAALSEYHIAWTIFPAADPIIRILDHEPGWRRLLDENGIVVHAQTMG